MDVSSHFIQYGVAALAVTLSSLSISISEGFTSFCALAAINRQPAARNEITKVAIVGMALIETVAILGLIISVLLLMQKPATLPTAYAHYSGIGIAIAMGISSIVVGLASAFPVREACYAVARQPFFAQRILSLMVVTLILTQTPMISSFLVSLFIYMQSAHVHTAVDCMRLIASGICVGVGSIGPVIGLSIFARTILEGLGINKNAYSKLLSFTFISGAIIETPIIFCLIIALMLLFLVKIPLSSDAIKGIVFVAAGTCAGFGTFGPGISSGKTAAAACMEIAKNPTTYSIVSRASLLAQGMIETLIIYSVVLSLSLLLFM